MVQRRRIGDRWERRVETWLKKRGLITIERNYNSRWGEIDLVCEQNEAIVFVEVRFRSGQSFGGGAASVNHHKQQRIIRAAGLYLAEHPEYAQRPCRFDVVDASGDDEQGIHWIENAFTIE